MAQQTVGKPNTDEPNENHTLAMTSGTFRKTSEIMGGVPTELFAPALDKALSCLMGITSFFTLKDLPIHLLVFVAVFLGSDTLLNFIVFDLVEKDNCIDILINVTNAKPDDRFYPNAVLNYMQGQFNMNSKYINLTLKVNMRRLRWELSRKNGDNTKLNRLAHFPSKCEFCKKTVVA